MRYPTKTAHLTDMNTEPISVHHRGGPCPCLIKYQSRQCCCCIKKKLPVRYRILFKVLVLTYHALHGTGPPYIKSLLNPYIPSHALRSASKLSLTVPHYDTIFYGARAFSRFAPVQYNQLPESLSKSPTLSAFKSGLKAHLFQLAFS